MTATGRARWAVAGVALSFAFGAQAEWSGKGELGLVIARGNTSTETVNVKADTETQQQRFKHALGFAALRSTSNSVVTGDRYELHGQSNFEFSERGYTLGALRYENDKFSSYSYQAVGALGLGVRFYNTDTTKFESEIGVGYRRAQDRLTQEVTDDAIARGGLHYDHKLTDNSSLYDRILVESGEDNTFAQNEAGIKANINSLLALSITHVVRYNSRVLAPMRNTNQLITANLVFSY